MGPDQGADGGYGQAGRDNGPVAENRLSTEHGEYLGDDPHAGQNHDIDRRVRVHPEQVLEHQRVAALRRVEQADAEQALDHDQKHGDADDRGRQNLHPRGRVYRPGKERYLHPAHPLLPERVDRGYEVDAREH